MTTSLISILALAVTAGQLIRVPIGAQGGVTILDITVSLFCLGGLFKIGLRKPPPQIIAALAFLSFATLSLIFTPLHLKTGEYIISFSYTIRFFLYVVFAWLVFSDTSGDFRKNLVKVFLLSGIAFASLGILQFIFFPDLTFLSILGWDPHYFRTASTFFDPNFAGAFLTLTLILLASSREPRLWRGTWQSNLFFVLIYLALLTTFSRSSYLMFLVSGLTFSFLKKSKAFIFATILLFAILLAGFQIYTNLVSKPRNIDRIQSASFRLNTWQQGWQLFTSHSIFGVGFNAYRYALRDYNLADRQFLSSHGSSSNDSSLLSVAATTGIVGLLSYFFFLGSLIRTAFRSGTNYLLVAGLSGLLIHSFFANSLFYPPILAWILLISTTPKK